MTRHSIALSVFLACGGGATALAQTPPPAPAPPTPAAPAVAPSGPSVKVGATLFADYTYSTSPTATDTDGNAFHPQAFNVTRSYLNVTGTLSKVVAFRFTPDIAREAGAGSSLNGSLTFRVKYAYVQTNLDQWMRPGTWVRFGVQQTPLVDFMENIYRYRFQGTMFEERDGALSSSDAGVSFHTNLPHDYGDVHVGVYNGEKYTKPEVNDQKAIEMRGTVRPLASRSATLKGLRVTGYYRADHYVKNADRSRAVLGATYEHPHLTAGATHLWATDQASARTKAVDSSGFSIWAIPRVGNGWEGLLRIDRRSPNSTTDERQTRAIAGVAYWVPLPSGVSTAFLLNLDRLSTSGLARNPKPDARVGVHALVSF